MPWTYFIGIPNSKSYVIPKAQLILIFLNATNDHIDHAIWPIYDPFKYFFKYFLGGDEVGYGCWQSNPNITAWMKENNVTTYQKLEEYWVKNILDISKKQNFGTDWENFKILKLKTDNMKWTLAKCVTFLTWSFRYLSHLDNLNPIFHVFSRTLS